MGKCYSVALRTGWGPGDKELLIYGAEQRNLVLMAGEGTSVQSTPRHSSAGEEGARAWVQCAGVRPVHHRLGDSHGWLLLALLPLFPVVLGKLLTLALHCLSVKCSAELSHTPVTPCSVCPMVPTMKSTLSLEKVSPGSPPTLLL